jgi:UDP-N-acetylmuramate: L-alanyl-gamma-D-glutamyl-meso-diaminopimelate ligase
MCAANVKVHRRAGNRRALDTQSPLDQNKAWFFIRLGVIMLIDCGARIHLIAICGTAMGALAGMLRERGFRVTGSDARVYPPMSTFLRDLGIQISEGFTADNIRDCDLVVVGNAVSRGNPEVEATLDRRVPYLSLPEVLRELFLRDKRPVVVAGTHGKTTTTAITAHLLLECGLDPSFLVAGLPRNWERPYRLGAGDHFVIEGDEYDSAFFYKIAKFFFYLPEILIINNIEFDHADIYRDLAEVERAFQQLINIVPSNGLILAHQGDPVLQRLLPHSLAPVQTFGMEPGATLRAVDLDADQGSTSFGLLHDGRHLGRFTVAMSGDHNIRNCLAGLGVGLHAGLTADQLRQALPGFLGVHRRQETLGREDGVLLIDDFAHHPTAVGETLSGLRAAYPAARFHVLFEPASATNARALFEERYVAAFRQAAEIVIGSVPRPERARGDAPLDPERLAAALRASGKSATHIPTVEAIVAQVAASAQPGDVVVVMSNGGFGGLQQLLLQALHQRPPRES